MGETVQLAVPSGGRQRADEWALVLISQDIDVEIHVDEAGFSLLVPAEEGERAAALLESYRRENIELARARAAEPREEPLAEAGFAGVILAGAFFLVFGLVGGRAAQTPIFLAATADAARILDGEFSRALTALFLHADLAHVVGNALFGVYFITAVTRSLGDGLGLLAVLAAGAVGNLMNAYWHGGDHHSVGASTAVFGAIGILAGAALARRSRAGLRGRRRLVPIAAGLGLLAMLGVGGARVDVWAHVYGLLAGGIFGSVLSFALPRRPGMAVQALLTLVALAGVALCWQSALASAAPGSGGVAPAPGLTAPAPPAAAP